MKRRYQKILLVNPNRYREPPVIPLGLEYLAHTLRARHFSVRLLDLCFSHEPLVDLTAEVQGFDPDAVCLSIRNVDSVLYPDTDYFLPAFQDHIREVKALTRAPVIIGGSAMTADPEGIVNFLGADFGIVGPGEVTLPSILEEGGDLVGLGRIARGAVPVSFCPQRGHDVDYQDYLDHEGLPGFETHKGCSSDCVYCIEAGTALRFREPEDVICELRQLAEQGFRHLHLCDTEFNENLPYCLALLGRMNREKLGLQWGLYMKVGNYNEKLFELLKESGAYLVTLTVDSYAKGSDYWAEVTSMIARAKRAGIRLSVDFLTGFPYEDEETLFQSLDVLREARPHEVVVNTVIRLYANIGVTAIVERDPSLRQHLIYPLGPDRSLLAPTFYSHVQPDRLQELVGSDPLFRIAGAERVVNYQKVPKRI
ncbi:MAG: cobalamin-dependent protein [bacterium]|nr:cobalamin-dependent protein [bacterium]